MFYHLLRMAFASYISCLMHSWFHNYALCNMHLLLHIHVHPLIHTLYPLLHIPFCNTNLFALYTFFRFTYLLTHTTLDSYALCFTYLFASHTSCLIQLLIYTPFALIPFASHTFLLHIPFCFTYLLPHRALDLFALCIQRLSLLCPALHLFFAFHVLCCHFAIFHWPILYRISYRSLSIDIAARPASHNSSSCLR